MKTVLVTGSAGFIGFHVSKKLMERSDLVIGLDNFNSYYDPTLKESRNKILEQNKNFKLYRGGLEDSRFIKKVFSENKISKVCHLAAQAGVRYSLENPMSYIQSNIVGFQNIVEEAKNNKIENFVYASSSSVYGANKKFPSSEEDSVDHPISLYAATKKSNELVASAYHHLFGINCTGLRYFTVYGPWGRPDMALFYFVKNIAENKPINVFNSGKMERDFTYIDDIVDGTIAALDADLPCEILNLGRGKPENLMDFIKEIENALGKKAKINYLPMQAGDVEKSYADTVKAKALLDYQPKMSIAKGVQSFVRWYKGYLTS